MHKIKAYRSTDWAKISQISLKRDWMDDTWNAHAYHCFPVSLANKLGWGISFPEDISFIWDGINDSSPEHVKILKGEKYVSTGRANATISFNTGIKFKTEENITLLQMPVPNQPIDGITPFTTLISSSFFKSDFPCAWIITKPNVEILIKANTPVIAIVPINLEDLQDSEIEFCDFDKQPEDLSSYANAINEKNLIGKWSDFYRNATDEKGNKIGSHQLKKIKLHVK